MKKTFRYALYLLVVIQASCVDNTPPPDIFQLPMTYKVGKKPSALFSEDLNNDGFPDLMVANSASDTLSFFAGNGDGTFKEPATMHTGREPMALTSGDFDGDGLFDVAVCNYGDGEVSIILGQKDGMFKKKESVKVGRLPIAIVHGDFNNDQKTDLAVTLRFNKLIILLGVGDGTFKLAESYQAAGTPAFMTVGDFNNDKNADIAVALNGVKVKHIKVFYGNGNGTFESPQKLEGTQSSFITQYDMNMDGNADLIISNTMFDSLSIFLSGGNGTFKRMSDFAGEKGPEFLVAGEFTGDRIPDIVACNKRDGSVSVIPGRGDGTFVYPHFNYPVGSSPRAIVGADFNQDGLTDLAVLLYDSQTLEIMMRSVEGVSKIDIDS